MEIWAGKHVTYGNIDKIYTRIKHVALWKYHRENDCEVTFVQGLKMDFRHRVRERVQEL